MGAVIDTLQSDRKILETEQLLSKFTIPPSYQLALMKEMKNGIIFQARNSEIFKVSQLKQSFYSQKTSNRSKLAITHKIRSNGEDNFYTTQIFRKRYIIKKLFLCGNNEATLMKILNQINLRNGELEINKNQSNICKINGYLKQFQPFTCGSQSTVRLVFEHFDDYSLEDEIKIRADEINNKTQRIRASNYNLGIKKQYSFTIIQIIRVTKFLLDVSEQLVRSSAILQNSHSCFPKISLSDVILLQRDSMNKINSQMNLKYRNPIDSVFCHGRQLIYNSISVQYVNINLESHILSNIGLCILSLCLLEDCFQSCCNFGRDICVSVVEEKLNEVTKIYGEDNEVLMRKLYNMIETFTFQTVAEASISLSQAKSMCNKMFIDFQKKTLKQKSDDTTQILLSELSTSFTLLKQRRRGIFDNKQPRSLTLPKSQKQNGFCSFSFPCRTQQDQRYISNLMKLKRTGSIQNKIQKENQKGWSIEKSSQKKILINNSLKPRTQEWKIENTHAALRRIDQNLLDYDYIDKKWSQHEDLFKDMPQFQKLQSNLLNFPAYENEIEHIHSKGLPKQLITALR